MVGQTWQFGGVRLNTKAWSVIEIPEGIGTPGFRGDNLQVPFQNGSRCMKKRYDERVILLPMWVRGLDPLTGQVPSGQSETEALYNNIDYLLSVFGKRGEQVLRRQLPDETIREAKAEVYRPVSFIKKYSGFAKCAVELLLADPFFYGTTETTDDQTIDSTEYQWTHNNQGTAPLTSAVITLTGPMGSPKLENLSNNIWLQYQGSIAAGETVVIGTSDFTCINGTTNVISNLKHGGDAYWLILESGDNLMKLTTDTVGGTCKIEYYPAYF